MRELVMEKVRKHFQPEFINRIDEFIIFEPLAAEQIETIVRLQVRPLCNLGFWVVRGSRLMARGAWLEARRVLGSRAAHSWGKAPWGSGK
jgi:hypothetical protein